MFPSSPVTVGRSSSEEGGYAASASNVYTKNDRKLVSEMWIPQSSTVNFDFEKVSPHPLFSFLITLPL